MKKIIVRADDLGYSEAVNYGIAKTVRQGIINNVSLMVNLPAANQGYQLLANSPCCLGLHVNISSGKPLSAAESIPSLVEETVFKKSAVYNQAKTDVVAFEEAVQEVQKQLERFRELTGADPAYLDIHAVLSPNFIEAAKRIADQNDLPFIGIPSEKGMAINHQQIKLQIAAGENETELMQFFKTTVEDQDQTVPLLVYHPGFIDAVLIRNSSLVNKRVFETSFLISKELIDYIQENDIHLLKLTDI